MWNLKVIIKKITFKSSRHHNSEVTTNDLKACLMRLFCIRVETVVGTCGEVGGPM